MTSVSETAVDPLRGLRILHATDSFLPNIGGLELSTAALARNQAKLGRVVAVATPRHPDAPDRESFDGIAVHRLPMTLAHLPGAYESPKHLYFPPVPDPSFARAFARLVKGFRPDVIHVRGWVLYSVLGAARRSGVPVVASAHDHSPVCAIKVMRLRGRGVCTGPALGKCIGCAYGHYGIKGVPLAIGLHQLGSRRHGQVARWTATSSALAARGSAPRIADRRAMTVIPTFIDDDVIVSATDRRTARRPDFVPKAGPYIFYAGVLGAHKGVDVLLDAYERLRAGGVMMPLVLAGIPRDDFGLENRLAGRPGVIVATDVPHQEVIAAWRHAHVGVVPSVIPEAFGRVAVECLAAGTPVVVSALGGLLDIVTDGVDGLQVPPGNAEALAKAVRRLIDDEALRARLASAGPARAAGFMLSRVAPRVDEVYLAVVNDVQREQPTRQEEFQP